MSTFSRFWAVTLVLRELLYFFFWSGLPCPPPRDLPDPGIESTSLHCRQVLYHWATGEVDSWIHSWMNQSKHNFNLINQAWNSQVVSFWSFFSKSQPSYLLPEVLPNKAGRFFFNWRIITLKYCGIFLTHRHESAKGAHVFPYSEPRSHLPPSPSHPSRFSQSTGFGYPFFFSFLFFNVNSDRIQVN